MSLLKFSLSFFLFFKFLLNYFNMSNINMAESKQDSTDRNLSCTKSKVKFTLVQAMKSQRWSIGIALLFL